MSSRVKEVLEERALAKDANKKIIEEALILLEDLYRCRCTINYLMDVKEAKTIIDEATQALSEL